MTASPDPRPTARRAGVTIPLFAIRTAHDWGIGDIDALPACAGWIRSAGHRLLQILPPYELAEGETSPYGARTAFGIDPIYISIDSVPDLQTRDIAEALGEEGAATLERLRRAPRVEYHTVRALKRRVLARAFEQYVEREWARGTARAHALRAFVKQEEYWAPDLALYVALRERHHGYGWTTWPSPERDRATEVIARARSTADGAAVDELGRAVLRHQYLQWLAHEQWDRARAGMREVGVELMGDLPFVVGEESADVWARPNQFLRDVSLGAPPDDFSREGQEWGLPAYNWPAMDADDLGWVRARTRHAARLYDRFRLDHAVGYFRMWVKPHGGAGRFEPGVESAQLDRGTRVLGAMLAEAAGAVHVVAEDLGLIPPWVRTALVQLGIPGYRVIPWEREAQRGFRDPRAFPALSVASLSTHDTKPITAWWEDFSAAQRRQLAALAGVDAAANPAERSLGLLSLLLRAGSGLTLALPQEILGTAERINTPGTITEANWTYRLPQPLENLATDSAVRARLEAIRALANNTTRD
ncbi:MAG: 4-alpha-glucanotransferase [Candidatus Rokuibacteriota bacterium]